MKEYFPQISLWLGLLSGNPFPQGLIKVVTKQKGEHTESILSPPAAGKSPHHAKNKEKNCSLCSLPSFRHIPTILLIL